MTTVRIRTKNSLGFRGFESRELCPGFRTQRDLAQKSGCNPRPLEQELRSATAFRVQLTFLNACAAASALKSKGAAVELALPAAARAKER